ncbi:chaplin family protein [Herbidospora cretacea]|uniref:chaplin family protein n=1 Tax=Herbidospora cretacea TaxID=28444 RepID=UPI0005577925|nr:chaplin family protein [Herbidospora cretacea]
MRTWAKGSAPAALLAAGVMALGTGTAVADTDGQSSIGGGNQVNLPVSLPIDLSGNAVGVAGGSTATSKGGASVDNSNTSGKGIQGNTSGKSSVLGGNQVNAPVSAPINACGNAIALFGNSDAGCKGGSEVKTSGHGGAGKNTTNGDHSLLGGNQVTAPISAPINACGNAVAIFGDAVAGCKGGSTVKNTGAGPGGNSTSGRSAALGGNQVIAPISAPINVCGVTVAVFGDAFSGCKGGSTSTNGDPGPKYQHGPGKPGSTGNDTDGRFGAGSGNQVIAPVNLPVNVCGNAIGGALAGCKGGSEAVNTTPGTGAGGNTTDGRSGVVAGNQVVAPITAPINICGNAVALFGEAFAGCKGGATAKNGGKGAGGNTTSGRSGVVAGNQVIAPITAPINACGNAVAAAGGAEAHCTGEVSAEGGPGGGGNKTNGKSGVLAGNQIIAPITAPINACGNAVAGLGDAAAGCLGGSRVGRSVHHTSGDGYDNLTQSWGKVDAAETSGPLPALPAMSSARQLTKMSASGLPLVGDLPGMLGLPALPGLPGAPAVPAAAGGKKAPAKNAQASPLAPVTGAAQGLPVAGSLGSAASALPVGGLGLMSAAQPDSITGMNAGSLAALLLGAMFAASATLFAGARRLRFGRRK